MADLFSYLSAEIHLLRFYFRRFCGQNIAFLHFQIAVLRRRRPFAKDKSLKGEFIRTVMGRAELPEEDKATVIHYGLQALAGEEILDA